MELISTNYFLKDRYQLFVLRFALTEKTKAHQYFHISIIQFPFQIRVDIKEMSGIGFRQSQHVAVSCQNDHSLKKSMKLICTE